METDDYELIPLNPIRRLEKRIERIENVKDKEIFDELLQTIKINQETVDQLTKMNTDLVKEITTLSGSIENLSSKLSDFLERVEVESLEAPDEEYEKIKEENKKFAEKEEKLTEKVQMLEKKINALLLSSLAKKRMAQRVQRSRRPGAPRPVGIAGAPRPNVSMPAAGPEPRKKIGLPLP